MNDRSFLDVLCDFRRHFRILVMISVLSIVVLLASLRYVDPGTGAFVVAIVQLMTFGPIAVAAGGLMVLCGRRSD